MDQLVKLEQWLLAPFDHSGGLTRLHGQEGTAVRDMAARGFQKVASAFQRVASVVQRNVTTVSSSSI